MNSLLVEGKTLSYFTALPCHEQPTCSYIWLQPISVCLILFTILRGSNGLNGTCYTASECNARVSITIQQGQQFQGLTLQCKGWNNRIIREGQFGMLKSDQYNKRMSALPMEYQYVKVIVRDGHNFQGRSQQAPLAKGRRANRAAQPERSERRIHVRD